MLESAATKVFKMLKRSSILNRELSLLSKANFVYAQLRKRFIRHDALLTAPKKQIATLPDGGQAISVEEALNSRCTSDSDGRQKAAHWGMMDRSLRLSEHDIEGVKSSASLPGICGHGTSIETEGDYLVFLASRVSHQEERNRLMIENGMRQQALLLACAALGIGTSIFGLGNEGVAFSEQWQATVRIRLSPMKPSYAASYWTSSLPGRPQKWLSGNLPDPQRKGREPLLPILDRIRPHNVTGRQGDIRCLSQILWAARGRTPHYYHSIPWGLTIPTCGGRQDNSRLFIAHEGCFYAYQNWHKKHPTHSLTLRKDVSSAGLQETNRQFPGWNGYLIITAKDDSFVNLLEVGYQALNIMLQAHVLNLGYEFILLSESQRRSLSSQLGVTQVTALVALNIDGPLIRQFC